MILTLNAEAFVKASWLHCFAESLSQRAIQQIEIRLVRVGWQQESGVRTAGLVCDIRGQ